MQRSAAFVDAENFVILQFPNASRCAITRKAVARATALGLAALLATFAAPPSAAAQQAPRRFYVFAKQPGARRDLIALIDRAGARWTELANDIQRGGRLSPDGTTYAFVGPSPGEKKSTLHLVDLTRRAAASTIELDGLGGGACWSPD
jgi:hypothetical protein